MAHAGPLISIDARAEGTGRHGLLGLRRFRLILLVFGILNGVLYSALLPLWEGFDEPFHYGYVQFLSQEQRIPVLGKTVLSEEVWRSIQLVPVSHVVRHGWTALTTYDRYFQLSESQRAERRERLRTLDPSLGQALHGEAPNYEAHQPPLSYMVLGIADRILSALPIAVRVLWLRILCVCLSVPLLLWATLVLARSLGLPSMFQAAALLCVFSSQMLYATIAHVGNDWLAVPLAVWCLVASIGYVNQPGVPRGIRLGFVLALGLLTKAYFIVFAVAASGIVAWPILRKRASYSGGIAFVVTAICLSAPWYFRNMVLYGNVSGTVEAGGGIGFVQVAQSLWKVPWTTSIPYMARASLWTGNNSFTTFSRATLNIWLAGLFAALVIYFWKMKRCAVQGLHGVVLAGTLLYCFGIVYATVSSFLFTHRASAGASPWYMQPLLAPVLCLAFLGLARAAFYGRVIASCLVALSVYVIGATYVAKLIPLYGGYEEPRSNMADLYEWYRHKDAGAGILRYVCLADPAILFWLLGLVVLLALGMGVYVVSKLLGARDAADQQVLA